MSCAGLTSGTGGEGACITSRMFFGGWLYPDAPNGATDGEGTVEGSDADCARTPEDVAQATSAETKRHFRAFCTGISALHIIHQHRRLQGRSAESWLFGQF